MITTEIVKCPALMACASMATTISLEPLISTLRYGWTPWYTANLVLLLLQPRVIFHAAQQCAYLHVLTHHPCACCNMTTECVQAPV